MKDSTRQILKGLAIGALSAVILWEVYKRWIKKAFSEFGAAKSGILTVTLNNTTSVPQTVTILDPTTIGGIPNVPPGVQISSFPKIEFFTQTLKADPVRMNRVEVRSSSQEQQNEVITIRYRKANGKLAQAPFYPRISPYQFQTSIAVANLGNNIFDVTSSISDYTILPNTKVTLLFFWWK